MKNKPILNLSILNASIFYPSISLKLVYLLLIFSFCFSTNCISEKNNSKDTPTTEEVNQTNTELSSIAIQQATTQIYYAKNIEAINLKNHIELLASESFEGRKVGEKGQKMAGLYIQDFFIKNDLEPSVPTALGNRYLQEFEIESSQLENVTLKSTTNAEISYQNKEGFLANPFTYLHDEPELNVVLTGFSVLPNEQINGRGIALFLNTEDKDNLFYSNQEENGEMEKQLLLAQKGGAKAIFWILTNTSNYKTNLKKLQKEKYLNQEIYTLKTEKSSAVYFLSMETAAKLFDYKPSELEELAKQFEESQIPSSLPYTTVSIEVKKKKDKTYATENVVGFVEGTELKEEVIVISAHYDHLGLDLEFDLEQNKKVKTQKNKFFAGADDNASGVAALLELAKTFAKAKQEGFAPKRSILFLALTAEEVGMLGSSYYTDISPLFPLSSTITNLNIDMIGREYTSPNKYPKNNYVSLVGSDWLSPILHQTNEKANATFTKLNLDYSYNSKSDPEEFFYRSDQYSFAKYGIPVIFYTSPDHKDYHQTSDTADKIDFQRVEKITKLIFHTTWQLANQKESPKKVEKNTLEDQN